MVPAPSLVSNGYALADPARTKLLYFLMGKNDQFNSGTGGPVTLRLSSVDENFAATWFDPRTGNETGAGVIQGGRDFTLSAPNPSSDDWVLLLVSTSEPPSEPLAAPILLP